jgi:hypothetical protein
LALHLSSHATVDRLQFALTVTFHYLFPILTMGLALVLAHLKSVAYLGGEHRRLRLLRKTAPERETLAGRSRRPDGYIHLTLFHILNWYAGVAHAAGVGIAACPVPRGSAPTPRT